MINIYAFSPGSVQLLDFSKSMEPSSEGRSCDPGWHRVAWAFLKLVGGHGNPNTYKKCRLQLFQYPHRKRQQRVSPQPMEDGVNGIQVIPIIIDNYVIPIFTIDLPCMEFFAKSNVLQYTLCNCQGCVSSI